MVPHKTHSEITDAICKHHSIEDAVTYLLDG